jgi:hypothetical protein
VVLNGHQREGDLEAIRHLPLRGRTDDVRFRAARFVVQVFQTREQPLAFGCAEGPGAGEDHQQGQKRNQAVLIHRDFGPDGNGPRNRARAELLLNLPKRAVRVASFQGDQSGLALGLQGASCLGGIGETEPTHLASGHIAN